ncbi:galactose-6-phosphate isomerase subunit LacA [Vagococcus lutrae]|uniref:galactose-6-phosphate isomerase subunit LacA n=1 Tax=Vagococcus lutrae TaxID=81947 RepID=UPI000F87390C|nr:galactose-6-phosphate isomerase subunit LacA [Vagococcus lutrae]MDT2801068.1 galactose-6-phosphate isomerase subunit LacA [Vagococcus lutrae]RST93402.1 galactose-6-phosphate isomerase subunit LacA [Vagococcus lutrae]UQF23373.1 galactose-6-phosphate isomerase subunit LacA [Vagococcus lutrae]UQF38707.1 galactose-6-phosphate isomerase subunit LacA [Vagococcus lutrae]UQF64543.1 galactose-6-phosphate isomerase subunit LacA [Vagococcus lutrae]
MKVIIGADNDGFELKEKIKNVLTEEGFSILDVSEKASDTFVESTEKVVNELKKNKDNLGVSFDAYGAGSFMVATKHKGMIAAEVSEERSAYMTREHNNSQMITIGSQIVGEKLAENIVLAFLKAEYDGGRHQIRVDMLNKMI